MTPMLIQRRAARLVVIIMGVPEPLKLASGNYRHYVFSQANKIMTTTDQENIERKLNHVIDMGHNIIELYPHITCTERVSLLLAMTAAVKQVSTNVNTVAALLRRNLLDPFRINYMNYAYHVENLLKIWDEELKGAPIFHNLDNQSRPITDPYDIIEKEDTDYDLSISTQDRGKFDFGQTRVGLMKNAALMNEEIENGLGSISKTLRGIVDDYQKLKSDAQRQDESLKQLERMYEEAMWEDDKERFVEEVEEYTYVNREKTKRTYQHYLNNMIREATDPHYIRVLAELNGWYLEGQRPAAFIVENRDKLTIEDLARHFRFVRCRQLLIQQVASFDLLQPADEEYKDLFVNQASQEMAFLLATTIGTYVDFRHNYQYAAFQMAMQDLGLIYNDRNNGIQMKEYVNKAYLTEDDQIKDQTTLTQWTGKLLGCMFGTMDEKHLRGNYSLKDFEKMKDFYWLCLSIINKVMGVDLKELKFAPYLYMEHEKTPDITDFKNKEGADIMERLLTLKSAIRGETLFR